MTNSRVSSNCMELGKKYGYLPYMIERFIDMIGEKETIELLHFNETKLNPTIRLNSLRAPFAKTANLLEQKRVKIQHIPDLKACKEIISSSIPLGASPEYLNGYYMLQGKNSLYPPKILAPQKGEIIGDFAAAPGGKTTHLAQIMHNEGIIVAIEKSTNRCRSLHSNLVRMGVKNTIILNFDSRRVSKFDIVFDRILLDAPCSGSGVIITDKSRKNSKTMDDILSYHQLQTQMLAEAIKVLRVGGTIVYCTCSLEPEENELVITKMLDKYALKLNKIKMKGDCGLNSFLDYSFHPELEKAIRLYPHKTQGEGFFIAKMVKLE